MQTIEDLDKAAAELEVQLIERLKMVNNWVKFAETKNAALVTLGATGFLTLVKSVPAVDPRWAGLVGLISTWTLVFLTVGLIIALLSFMPQTHTPAAITALIAAGACDRRGARRHLLWALQAAWRGAAGLPVPVMPVALPVETTAERLAGEEWATGLPLRGHIAATQRAAWAAHGVLPLAALTGLPAGRPVSVAGRVAIIQRPPTAGGICFVSLEDETGSCNLVLQPETDRGSRAALHGAPLVVATGRVQRRGAAIGVQVEHIEPWIPHPID